MPKVLIGAGVTVQRSLLGLLVCQATCVHMLQTARRSVSLWAIWAMQIWIQVYMVGRNTLTRVCSEEWGAFFSPFQDLRAMTIKLHSVGFSRVWPRAIAPVRPLMAILTSNMIIKYYNVLYKYIMQSTKRSRDRSRDSRAPTEANNRMLYWHYWDGGDGVPLDQQRQCRWSRAVSAQCNWEGKRMQTICQP